MPTLKPGGQNWATCSSPRLSACSVHLLLTSCSVHALHCAHSFIFKFPHEKLKQRKAFYQKLRHDHRNFKICGVFLLVGKFLSSGTAFPLIFIIFNIFVTIFDFFFTIFDFLKKSDQSTTFPKNLRLGMFLAMFLFFSAISALMFL